MRVRDHERSLPVLVEYLCAVGEDAVEVAFVVQFIFVSTVPVQHGRGVVVGRPQGAVPSELMAILNVRHSL